MRTPSFYALAVIAVLTMAGCSTTSQSTLIPGAGVPALKHKTGVAETVIDPREVQRGRAARVGDSAGAVIYQFSFSNDKATLAGTTSLSGAGIVGQFGIADSTVVTPNQFFSGSGVLVYPYPGGGASTKSITNGVFYPFSAIISAASGKR